MDILSHHNGLRRVKLSLKAVDVNSPGHKEHESTAVCQACAHCNYPNVTLQTVLRKTQTEQRSGLGWHLVWWEFAGGLSFSVERSHNPVQRGSPSLALLHSCCQKSHNCNRRSCVDFLRVLQLRHLFVLVLDSKSSSCVAQDLSDLKSEPRFGLQRQMTMLARCRKLQ